MTWLVVAIALIGNICVIRKNSLGFYCWFFTDCYFLVHNILLEDYQQSMIFFLYILMAIYGLISWRKQNEKI